MTDNRTHPGGFVKDLAGGLSAGQPGVRYGGVRAHRALPLAAEPGLLGRLLGHGSPAVSCRHAMAHAGGAA